MNLFQSKIKTLREQEAIEPVLAWGVRMGLAVVIPLIVGTTFGLEKPMDWVALTAELICWVELKGTLKQRVRTVIAGTLLAVFFTALGALTASGFLFSVVAMLGTGFIAGLFKNLGDRGSGLSICVGAMFIISNALPAWGGADLLGRLGLTVLGGLWCILLVVVLSLHSRKDEAFRQSIALAWQKITALLETVSAGWTAGEVRNSATEVYKKETAVRQALDASMAFHDTLSDQITDTGHRDYNLVMARKTTALVATHVTAIGEAVEGVNLRLLSPEMRILFNDIWDTYALATNRLSSFMVSLQPEEGLLLQARLTRLEELVAALREQLKQEETPSADTGLKKQFLRAAQLTERSVGLMRHLISLLPGPAGEQRAYQSYSLLKTLYALHPGFLLQSARVIFRFRTENFRYAFRLAGALAIALFVAKFLPFRNSYWLPFTVMLVVQPYIGATLRKSLDRIVGTITGGIVAGIILFLPTSLFLKEALLFISSVFMVYYLRKNYAISAFFITVSLVMLLAVEDSANPEKILLRGLFTVAGSAIAIGAGFLLLPTWDRRTLPLHLAAAFGKNYQYLCFTLRTTGTTRREWVQHKRAAEQANSRAFESFQRYLREPDVRQKIFITPYQVLTHNMRLTRELNQVQLEREVGISAGVMPAEIVLPQTNALGTALRELSNGIMEVYKERGLLSADSGACIAALDSGVDIRAGEEELLEKMVAELKGLADSIKQPIG